MQMISLAMLAVILSPGLQSGSVATQPQPAPVQPAPTSAPCVTTPPAPPKPKNQWKFTLPPKLQQALDKQRKQLQNQAGITPPPIPKDAAKPAQPVKPCPAPPAKVTPPPPPPAPSPAKVNPPKTPVDEDPLTEDPYKEPETTGQAAFGLPVSSLKGGLLSPFRDTILDRRVLGLSDSDWLTVRSLCEGTLITGAPGSGKSSCSGQQLALALLSVPEMGGLVLTAKAEETQNWIKYAKLCGRESDLIVFNAESGLCFDPLHYEWTRPGRGAGDLEGIIDFFSTLASISRKDVGHGHDPFWERGNEQLMRNSIKLLDLAGDPVSIATIDRVIKSLPTRPGEHEDPAWQKEAHCAQLIEKVRARQEMLSADQWSDLEFATQYIFKKWPAFDERPRSSLEMTWSGMADRFLFNPFNRIFCSGKCSFTPEMTTRDRKIVICDFPMLEFGQETGRTTNVICKLIFQRAWLRRDLADSPNPAFLWQDEAQYFITRRDNFFQQTCRGSRIANVCLTQNILNLSEELGEAQPGSKTKSLLGNLGIKIFHQQNDTETCQFASDQIGREYRYLDSFNAGFADQGGSHSGISGSRQLAHIVEPVEFTRLAKPDGDSPLAQAIIYQSGKTFNATKTAQNPRGRSYLSVMFSRA